MKKFILLTAVGFATIAAAPASSKGAAIAAAQAGTSAQQTSNSSTNARAGESVEEKKICKLLPTSGTRFAERSCLTAKEWEQVEQNVKDNDY